MVVAVRLEVEVDAGGRIGAKVVLAIRVPSAGVVTFVVVLRKPMICALSN